MRSKRVKVDRIDNEQEQFEFHIVSLDNKQWHFEAASVEEKARKQKQKILHLKQ